MPDKIETLPGWMVMADAADRLGVSRQYAHKLARLGKLPGVRRVSSGRRQILLVPEESVLLLEQARQQNREAGQESVKQSS